MAEIVKFIYVMIIFLYLFLVSTNIEARQGCKIDYDCIKVVCKDGHAARCIMRRCECVEILNPIDLVST